MGEDHCSCVVRQRSLHDFPWVDARLGERSDEGLLYLNDPMLCIEPQAQEDFALFLGNRQPEVVAHCTWASDCNAALTQPQLQHTERSRNDGVSILGLKRTCHLPH